MGYERLQNIVVGIAIAGIVISILLSVVSVFKNGTTKQQQRVDVIDERVHND
jgi:hypothetical protein